MAEQLSLESVGPRVGLRVVSVWYVQPHEHPIERAAIRIATSLGEFYRDVDMSPEGLREARAVARGCGVELVSALDLRDVVAGWEVAGGSLGGAS